MHSALMVLWKERKETKEDYADRRSQEKLTVNMSFPLASANVKGQGGGGSHGACPNAHPQHQLCCLAGAICLCQDWPVSICICVSKAFNGQYGAVRHTAHGCVICV